MQIYYHFITCEAHPVEPIGLDDYENVINMHKYRMLIVKLLKISRIWRQARWKKLIYAEWIGLCRVRKTDLVKANDENPMEVQRKGVQRSVGHELQRKSVRCVNDFFNFNDGHENL